jgi:hypothetical protein
VEAKEFTQLAEETDLNIQAAAAIQESSTQVHTAGRHLYIFPQLVSDPTRI